MVNVTGRIVPVNSQAERVFGYPVLNCWGRRWRCCCPTATAAPTWATAAAFLANSRATAPWGRAGTAWPAQDGGEFPVEISLSRWRPGPEGLFVSSAIPADVTERKRIEQVLQGQEPGAGERGPGERPFSGQHVPRAAHAPQRHHRLYRHVAPAKLPGPLNAEQEKATAHRVQTGAKHLLSLINDLLDVAKLSANKVTLNLEPVDCKTLIEEVSATLELEARRKGLAFCVHTPPVDVLLLTDRRALSQILINLVGNAIKFTQQGRVDVVLQDLQLPTGRAVQLRAGHRPGHTAAGAAPGCSRRFRG